MTERAARFHAIERTSPKGPGQTFIGTCWQCGKANLTLAQATEVCENVARLTEAESLLLAVDGPEDTTSAAKDNAHE